MNRRLELAQRMLLTGAAVFSIAAVGAWSWPPPDELDLHALTVDQDKKSFGTAVVGQEFTVSFLLKNHSGPGQPVSYRRL